MSGEEYGVEDLNPRSQSVKNLEMTVLRGLLLIEAFDKLAQGEDWTDVPSATYRKVLGDAYLHGRVLEECWIRYQRGTLHREVQDLAANLPPAALGREEIALGLDRISARPNSRGKKPATKRPSGKRPRQQRLF